MSEYGFDPCNLPTLTFIGGGAQGWDFDIVDADRATPFDPTAFSGRFVINTYYNKENAPLVVKTLTADDFSVDTGGSVLTMQINLSAASTAGLCGKYIYQIALTESGGEPDILGQGYMYIAANIDRS